MKGFMGKTVSVEVRLTPEEKEVVRRIAKLAGMDMSKYIRRRILPEK